MEIKIPSLGDIDEVEVIELCAAVGDEVGESDTLIVIESDKASMDVPAGVAGKLTALQVSVGDMVSEGSVIAVVESADEGADDQKAADEDKVDESAADESKADESKPEDDKPEADKSSEDAAPASSGSREIDVQVPDIGDAKDVVVIEIAVSVGQQVEENDLLVVLESDKASMEIAAETAGEILEILVEEGAEVSQGTAIARLKVQGQGDADEADSGESDAGESGDGESDVGKSARDDNDTSAPAEKTKDAAADKPQSPSAGRTDAAAKVYAGPASRRLARELGVDISQVKGTGQRQRILKDDVKAYVKEQLSKPAQGGGLPQIPAVDFARFGEIETLELTRIRQRGVENLHRSWVNVPHVTQHDEVDISDLEAFRAGLKKQAEDRGVRVTPLAFIIKACARVLRETPEFNSSLHPDHKQLILKKYINIGMAVDTPEGLVVPVIRDADQKDIWQLSEDIAQLSAKARDKKLGMDDLQGGTFSVSSLGALGGTGFTPIVNAPEVAILGVARLQTKPVWNGEQFMPAKVLPLALSYDHRVINGADGGRFMQRLCELLGDIRHLAL